MSSRALSLNDNLRRLENEELTSSEDDLDLVKSTAKNLLSTVNDDNYIKPADTDDTTSESSPVASPGVNEKNPGQRIVWSDDDDDLFTKPPQNKDKKKAAAARQKKQPRKAKSTASGPSIVGKKAATRPDTITKPSRDFRTEDALGSDSDDDENAAEVPHFFKQRQRKFEAHRKKLGEAGLRLPPTYDDIHFSDDERLEQLSVKPVFPKLKPCAPYQDVELRYSAGIVPAPIAQRLRDYQVEGAEFLHELFVFQRGGILGDDMGLGKTIQVIAFLTAAFGKTGDERDAKRMRKVRRVGDGRWYPKVLIICPGGLMINWKMELQRWGWWQVDIFHGSGAARDEVLSAARMGRLEIMITTYTTYRNHRGAINLIAWDCVVADECHQIKERKAEITKAMNEVNALCRIGLTGTAIQNTYDELWTILNWTNPGSFGPPAAWKASISTPLKLGQAHDATVAELAKARKTAKKLVQNLLPSFFKRRMKSLIADQLPKKSDKVVFCPLTDAQSSAYENLIESDLIQYIRTSSEPCDCNRNTKRGWCCYKEIQGHGRWQNYVFPMLSTLQKLSNHLSMLVPSGTDQRYKQDKDLECLQLAAPELWRDLYRDRDNIMNYANQDFCGKWKVLKKLLSFWHTNDDKVLVFSHSVRLLKMLQMLFKATTAYNVAYLDGAMSYEDRSLVVDDFNSNPTQFVFLISTKAGGVGLNITSANKVVVFDPNWNPSYDLQAQDRAYRIGQTRDVEVFRLVSAGTVEEIVYARQIYKQQQANIAYNASLERRYFTGVQNNSDKKGEIFGLQNLFAFQGDNVVLREIVNKTNIAESKAGVSVADVDMSDDAARDDQDTDTNEADLSKEDAAISQLAALITSGGETTTDKKRKSSTQNESAAAAKKRKTDAVAAILAGAGVEYTHENGQVVGSSRVETRLSERAQQAGTELDFVDQHVFAKSQEINDNNDTTTTRRDDDGDDRIKYVYKPPLEVRKRQFVSMAAHAGCDEALDFALLVESWTQEHRRDFLDTFYRERRRKLMVLT